MLVFIGGGWGNVVGIGVVVVLKGRGKFTNVVLHDIIEPYSKVQV